MKQIHILFVFGFPLNLGGHFKSALAMAKSLMSLGYTVNILSPFGDKEITQEFLSSDIRCFPSLEIKKNKRFIIATGISRIIRACREGKVDIIHAQDSRSIAPSYLAAVLLRKKFIYTIAGGPVAHQVPPSQVSGIFYSQELIDGMTKKYGLSKQNISLIRARIDMNVYKVSEISQELIKKYQLPISGKKIFMAIRLDESKQPWLNTIFQFADKLSQKEANLRIIIAGDGPLLPKLKEWAASINNKSREGPIIHLIGPVRRSNEINQLYNFADIIVGNGRGILEAMACQKAVIVLGENGEGELVENSTVDEIAKFNFSGRHFRYKRDPSPNLISVLKHLIENEKELKKASEFGYNYIKNHMEVSIGAKQLSDVYQRAMNKKSSFFHYLTWSAKELTLQLRRAVRKRVASDRKGP